MLVYEAAAQNERTKSNEITAPRACRGFGSYNLFLLMPFIDIPVSLEGANGIDGADADKRYY
jgi:hypothetical protein